MSRAVSKQLAAAGQSQPRSAMSRVVSRGRQLPGYAVCGLACTNGLGVGGSRNRAEGCGMQAGTRVAGRGSPTTQTGATQRQV